HDSPTRRSSDLTPPMSARVLVPAVQVGVAERRRDEAIFEDALRVAASRPIDDCADPAVCEGRGLTESIGAAGRTVVMRNAELQDEVLEASRHSFLVVRGHA